MPCLCGAGVAHSLGKGEATSSNLVRGKNYEVGVSFVGRGAHPHEETKLNISDVRVFEENSTGAKLRSRSEFRKN